MKPSDEGSPKSFGQQVKAALELNKEKLQASKNGQKSEAKENEFSFDVKVAGTMTNAGNVVGG